MGQLEEIINESFKKVKRSFYQAPINGPEISDEPTSSKTAFINWVNKIVGVNTQFIKELSQYEDAKVICEGVITHEFGHYMFHPRNLSMNIILSHYIYEVSDFRGFEQIIYATFTDYENESLIIDNDLNKEQLKKSRQAMIKVETQKPNPLSAALGMLYVQQMNLDLEIELNNFDQSTQDEIKKAVEQLSKTIITSKQNYGLQSTQLYNWGQALLPLINKSRDNLCNNNSQGQGYISPEDVKEMSIEGKRAIEGALGDLIKELPKKTYDKIKKHFLGEEAEDKNKNNGIGLGSIEEIEAGLETIDYYINAAKAYGLYIKPRRQQSLTAVSIPFGKKDWKPIDPTIGINVSLSGGKLLPGLTKSVRQEQIPYPAPREVTPRCIIYKDGSGSMPNPQNTKDYATIAASIIALSYLNSGSEVGATIFDSKTSELLLSRNAKEVINKLCSYKGGGTSIDMNQLKKDLEGKPSQLTLDSKLNIDELKNNPLFKKYLTKDVSINFKDQVSDTLTDLYIITDGGISNLEELTSFLKDNPNYRPTIIHTDSSFKLNIEGYDQQTSGEYEGINILKAENGQDIINLTKKGVFRKLCLNN